MKSSSRLQQEAARELLIRRRAREDIIAYANAIDIPGKPVSEDEDEWVFQPIETTVADHHRLILRTVETTMLTPMGRSMLLLPPGSAKSTYASVVAPTYAMGKWPGYRIILGSYGAPLAKKHGRKARQIVRSPRFRGIWKASIPKGRDAVDDWALDNGSEYMAAGMLGGVTGNRANGIIIDDPIKGRQEADSATIRDRVKEEFQDSFRSRLLPNGWIIIIQTRWHEDDLAGSILPEGYGGESGMILCRDGQVWNVLCIPAKAERADDPLGRKPGDYIWPEWFPREHWPQFERVARTWSALYQQRPAPEEGSYFLKDWFRTYPGPIPSRKDLRIYGGSDYATKDKDGDWTVHVVVGIDADNRMIVLDVWRAQANSMAWVEAFCDLVNAWRPGDWGEEAGQILGGVGPWLEKRMLERKVYTVRKQFPAKASKTETAQSIRGRMALLGLYFPAEAPWLEAFQSELLSFPFGRNDDQVDGLAKIGLLLDVIERGGERVLQQTADDTWTPHGEAAPFRSRGPEEMSDGDLQQIADGGEWKPW